MEEAYEICLEDLCAAWGEPTESGAVMGSEFLAEQAADLGAVWVRPEGR